MKLPAGLLLALLVEAAGAHDFRNGSLVIDHPYAIAGGKDVFVRLIRNTGSNADRLLGGTAVPPGRIQLFNGEAPGALPLAPKSEVKLRHDGPWRLTLLDQKTPLKAGETLQVKLHFEHAPDMTVPIHVIALSGSKSR